MDIGIGLTRLRALLTDAGYTMRFRSDGTASTAVRVFPHQAKELPFTDRVRLASITGKGGLNHPIWHGMPRNPADSASGQPSVMFDKQPQYDMRLTTRAPIAPGRRGAAEKQPATAWDKFLAVRAVTARS